MISPGLSSCEHTLNTLRYADRVKELSASEGGGGGGGDHDEPLLNEDDGNDLDEDHDFQFKVKNARRFLEEGNKVKVTVMFRGREVTHPEFGSKLLEKTIEDLKDIGVVESKPVMFGRFMTMVLGPAKK